MGLPSVTLVLQLSFLFLTSFSYGQPPVVQPVVVTVTDYSRCSGASGSPAASASSSPFVASSSIIQKPQPAATLIPSVCSNTNLQDYTNFLPQSLVTFYYEQAAQNAASGAQNAYVGMSGAYPVIALEHCGFVSNIVCTSTTITISVDRTAFGMIGQWPNSGFLLAGVGCPEFRPSGAASTDTRFFALVSSFSANSVSLQITFNADHLPVDEAIVNVDISFGSTSSFTSGSPPVAPAGAPAGASAGTTAGASAGASAGATSSSKPIPTLPASLTFSTAAASSGPLIPPSSLPKADISTLTQQANFDQALDDALGYLDPAAVDFFILVFPGVPTSLLTSRSTLVGRGINVKSLLSKVATVVKAIPLPPAVQNIVKKATTIVSTVVKVAEAIIPPVNITPLDETYPISITTANFGIASVNTAFGPGAPIYKDDYIGFYCVDCGITGSMHVVGQISASLSSGVTKAQLSVTGPLHFGFNIALFASYKYQKSFEKRLANPKLSAFSIPGIVSVGPELFFGIGAQLNVNAMGSALVGVSIDWNQISTVIDLVNYKSSGVTGLKPNTITKNLQIGGSVDISGNAYAMLELDFGVDILSGKFKITGGFIEKPGINLGLTIQSSYAAPSRRIREIEGSKLEERGCQGIDAGLAFTNDLLAQFVAGPYSTSIDLLSTSIQVYSTCIPLPQSSTKSSSSTTTTSSSSTTTSSSSSTATSTSSSTATSSSSSTATSTSSSTETTSSSTATTSSSSTANTSSSTSTTSSSSSATTSSSSSVTTSFSSTSSSSSSTSSTSTSSSANANPTIPVSSGPYSYVSCYSDSLSTDLLSGPPMQNQTGMTVEQCASLCSGYAYMGLAYGSYCFCDRRLGSSTVDLPASDDSCNSTCTGNTAEFCGGQRGAGPYLQLYSASPSNLARAVASIIESSSLQSYCSTLLGYTIPAALVTVTQTLLTTATSTTPVGTFYNTIVTPTVTLTVTQGNYNKLKRNDANPVPPALSNFDPSIVSSGCSLEATAASSTSTVLKTTSTVLVITSYIQGPASFLTSTVSAVTQTQTVAPACIHPHAGLLNGDFEAATLGPWVPSADVPNQYGLSTSGHNSHQAFFANQMDTGGPYSTVHLAQTLTTCPGVTYDLSVDFLYHNYNYDDYLNIFVNGAYVISFPMNPQAAGPPNTWNTRTGSFIVSGTQAPLDIFFTGTNYELDNFLLDNVVINARTSSG